MSGEGFYLPAEDFIVRAGPDEATGEAMILLEQHMRGGSTWRSAYSIPNAHLLLVRLKTALDVTEALETRSDEPI